MPPSPRQPRRGPQWHALPSQAPAASALTPSAPSHPHPCLWPALRERGLGECSRVATGAPARRAGPDSLPSFPATVSHAQCFKLSSGPLGHGSHVWGQGVCVGRQWQARSHQHCGPLTGPGPSPSQEWQGHAPSGAWLIISYLLLCICFSGDTFPLFSPVGIFADGFQRPQKCSVSSRRLEKSQWPGGSSLCKGRRKFLYKESRPRWRGLRCSAGNGVSSKWGLRVLGGVRSRDSQWRPQGKHSGTPCTAGRRPRRRHTGGSCWNHLALKPQLSRVSACEPAFPGVQA